MIITLRHAAIITPCHIERAPLRHITPFIHGLFIIYATPLRHYITPLFFDDYAIIIADY